MRNIEKERKKAMIVLLLICAALYIFALFSS